jgi:hypothetical protein
LTSKRSKRRIGGEGRGEEVEEKKTKTKDTAPKRKQINFT